MRAGVVTFPGSNCDDDLVFTLQHNGGFAVDRLWHKDTPDLEGYDLVALPGGFSYGDYLRCGAIAGLSPIMARIKQFAASGGLTLGVCNGFQTLCEVGLLPGALAKNEHLNFICADVTLKVVSVSSPWTCTMKTGDLLTLPIAHGDGRYVIEEPQYLELKKKDQVLFTFADSSGNETREANPNGSTFSVAGICNERKNVFGLMPHPERATDLRTGDGKNFWNSIITTLRELGK